MLLIPDTPGARRAAALGAVLLSAIAVRFALELVRPGLGEGQAAIAGLTTAVLTAPAFAAWLGCEPVVPPERRASYRALCACAALAFLVFTWP